MLHGHREFLTQAKRRSQACLRGLPTVSFDRHHHKKSPEKYRSVRKYLIERNTFLFRLYPQFTSAPSESSIFLKKHTLPQRDLSFGILCAAAAQQNLNPRKNPELI